MRFLTNYAADLTHNPQVETLVAIVVDTLAFAVSAGDTFLPDPASYDDLFYKLVETGPIIAKFRELYSPILAPSSTKPLKPADASISSTSTHTAALETLISVSTHFYTLLFHQDGTNGATTHKRDSSATQQQQAAAAAAPVVIPTIRKKNLSPREVHRIIRQGYETLSIPPPDGLSAWEKWRETDRKTELKLAARCAVEDARKLVG